MGSENPTWGEERIANELLLKLGIQVSPRTVRKYHHYNAGRPHMALGPGVPDPPPVHHEVPMQPNSRHRRGESYAVRASSILGGLHHEYFLAPVGA